MKSGHSGLQRLLRNDCIEKKKSFCKACQVFFCRKTRDRELKSEISFYPIKYARKGALKKISFFSHSYQTFEKKHLLLTQPFKVLKYIDVYYDYYSYLWPLQIGDVKFRGGPKGIIAEAKVTNS